MTAVGATAETTMTADAENVATVAAIPNMKLPRGLAPMNVRADWPSGARVSGEPIREKRVEVLPRPKWAGVAADPCSRLAPRIRDDRVPAAKRFARRVPNHDTEMTPPTADSIPARLWRREVLARCTRVRASSTELSSISASIE